MKVFFPDLPLNSGFYRLFEVKAPEGSIVDAKWPIAVSGFVMPFEKIMSAIFEIWSQIVPERALACAFNLEYLMAGGLDARGDKKSMFMFYDWLPGGWGGRNGRDGCNVTSAVFGAGQFSQPVEGQERVTPILTARYEILTDSAGPGKWRGGAGLQKDSIMLKGENTVISYFCDRERSIVWGLEGGLPSIPHGFTLKRKVEASAQWLGAVFSNVPVGEGDEFSRPTAGGGGYGDPLERDPEHVRDDVIDDYVSIERAAVDYGVVIKSIDPDICEYEVDIEATKKMRLNIRSNRLGWLKEDPENVAKMFRAGKINAMDAVRHYAVILDWQNGLPLPKTTAKFREMFYKRTVSSWTN